MEKVPLIAVVVVFVFLFFCFAQIRLLEMLVPIAVELGCLALTFTRLNRYRPAMQSYVFPRHRLDSVMRGREANCLSSRQTQNESPHLRRGSRVALFITSIVFIDITTSMRVPLNAVHVMCVLPLFFCLLAGYGSQRLPLPYYAPYATACIVFWILYSVLRGAYLATWELWVSIVTLSFCLIVIIIQGSSQKSQNNLRPPLRSHRRYLFIFVKL